MSYINPLTELPPVPEAELNNYVDVSDKNVTAEPEPMGEPEPTAEVTSLLQVVAVLAGILGFLIMIENIVVLLALTKGKPKQRRSLSCFIANIAVADFFAGFHLLWFVCFDFFFIENKPTTYIIVMCGLWLVTIVVSVIGLFSFGLFRLKLARSNESYHLTRQTATITIIFSWMISIAILVIPPIAGWNCTSSPEQCSSLLKPFTKDYVLMLAVLVLFAIFGLFAIYFWMLHAVHQKVDKLQKKGNIKKKERQMIVSVLIIVSFFTVCIFPVAVCLFLDYANMELDSLGYAFPIVVLISFLNSVSNPFIYIWRLPSMKHALWRVLGRKGVMPENSSFKEMVLWKLSTKRKSRSATGSPKTKCPSESLDKLSRKYTSIIETNISNKL